MDWDWIFQKCRLCDCRPLHLWLTLMVIVGFQVYYSTPQDTADLSKALIWSTTDIDKSANLVIYYGNPDTYIPQWVVKNGNVSYSTNYTTIQGYYKEFGVLETSYKQSRVYFNSPNAISFSDRYLPGTGNSEGYINVLYLSNQVTGLSFDWVSGQLYWSDAGFQRIGLIDRTPYYWQILVDTNITSPQDVVVYPQRGYVFWIDSVNDTEIEGLDMASDERFLVASGGVVQGSKRLAIDFANQRLFWLDTISSAIGSINFDGSEISIWTSSIFSAASSFVFYKDYVFLGNNVNSVVHVYNVTAQQYLTDIRPTALQNYKGIIDVKMWSPESEPNVSSPCVSNRGGCDHFCITLNSTSRRCLCAMGFFLDNNGYTCVTRPLQENKFLLLADERQFNVFQINVETGEVRATVRKYLVPIALGYDPGCKCFYSFDELSKSIIRTSLDNGDPQFIMNVTGIEVATLAFDDVTGSLFYADYQQTKSIGQINLESKTTTTLLAETGSQPRFIVLDTNNRLIYWSDCGDATIERSHISNLTLNRSSVITGLNSCVVIFTIDFQGQGIYWGDEYGVITFANLDGTSRNVIHRDDTAKYVGLVVDPCYLYIVDSNQRQIQKLDRSTYQITNLTKLLFSNSSALIFYTNESASTCGPTTTMSKDSSTTNIAAIVAPIVCGLVVVVALIVTVGYVIKKRRASRITRPPLPSLPTQSPLSPSTPPSRDHLYLSLYDTIPDIEPSQDIDGKTGDGYDKIKEKPDRSTSFENDYLHPIGTTNHQYTTLNNKSKSLQFTDEEIADESIKQNGRKRSQSDRPKSLVNEYVNATEHVGNGRPRANTITSIIRNPIQGQNDFKFRFEFNDDDDYI